VTKAVATCWCRHQKIFSVVAVTPRLTVELDKRELDKRELARVVYGISWTTWSPPHAVTAAVGTPAILARCARSINAKKQP
jgi:hypothetical protein